MSPDKVELNSFSLNVRLSASHVTVIQYVPLYAVVVNNQLSVMCLVCVPFSRWERQVCGCNCNSSSAWFGAEHLHASQTSRYYRCTLYSALFFPCRDGGSFERGQSCTPVAEVLYWVLYTIPVSREVKMVDLFVLTDVTTFRTRIRHPFLASLFLALQATELH